MGEGGGVEGSPGLMGVSGGGLLVGLLVSGGWVNPKGAGPRVGPEGWGNALSHHKKQSFFPLFWGPSVEFWWCF